MDERNQTLQMTFLFQPADLRANRNGRLTPRQQARLHHAGVSMRMAMAVFVIVMLGTAAIAILASWRSGAFAGASSQANFTTYAILAAVVFAVIVIGFLASRKAMVSTSSRQFFIATGTAAVGRVRPESANYELKIGATKLRLLTQEQLQAFQPGVEYRVFYLPGPAPTILSAEVVGSEAELDAAAREEGETPPEQDQVVRMQQRARPILYVLPVLVLGIPLVGIFATGLSEPLRSAMWALLLLLAIGFVFWALRRVAN